MRLDGSTDKGDETWTASREKTLVRSASVPFGASNTGHDSHAVSPSISAESDAC